ncbi:MAG: riboflavin synthase [Qingshengfaniella sp.]
MFTGLITDLGTVLGVTRQGGFRVRIATGYDTAGIVQGASIACDGVRLTVIDRGGEGPGSGWFEVQASTETLARTTLGDWQVGTRVNLERALRLGDELGGHIVSGHVDGVAEIVAQDPDSNSLTLRAPEALARFLAPKGCVALNGTSLTVHRVEGSHFSVTLIPRTRDVTGWGTARIGDRVNLEIDMLARYVARLREWD